MALEVVSNLEGNLEVISTKLVDPFDGYITHKTSLKLTNNLVVTVWDQQNGISLETVDGDGTILSCVAMVGGGGDYFDPEAVDVLNLENMTAIELLTAIARQNGYSDEN